MSGAFEPHVTIVHPDHVSLFTEGMTLTEPGTPAVPARWFAFRDRTPEGVVFRAFLENDPPRATIRIGRAWFVAGRFPARTARPGKVLGRIAKVE